MFWSTEIAACHPECPSGTKAVSDGQNEISAFHQCRQNILIYITQLAFLLSEALWFPPTAYTVNWAAINFVIAMLWATKYLDISVVLIMLFWLFGSHFYIQVHFTDLFLLISYLKELITVQESNWSVVMIIDFFGSLFMNWIYAHFPCKNQTTDCLKSEFLVDSIWRWY